MHVWGLLKYQVKWRNIPAFYYSESRAWFPLTKHFQIYFKIDIVFDTFRFWNQML
jgi:hypothetical protein